MFWGKRSLSLSKAVGFGKLNRRHSALLIGLSGGTPTSDPAPRGGELFWARFFGAFAPKNRAGMFPPGIAGGMGLPTKPATPCVKLY